MNISEFPKGNEFWTIKWIDHYQAAHIGTTSTSVKVLLQRVDEIKIREDISRLTPRDVQDILGTPPNHSKILREAGATDDSALAVYVHAGQIPMLQTGLVFQNQVLVGQLPSYNTGIHLSLPSGDDHLKEVMTTTRMVSPANWTMGSYLALNNFEFRHVAKHYPMSRLWIVTYDGIDICIPHQVVFQTFYAPHTELAKAFTNGPWSMTRDQIVYAKPLESGLMTRIDKETGAFHVILQRRIPDRFARLVAMLYFDDYASRCAELIYTMAISDRRASSSSSWFASARFLYRPGTPLNLHLNGYYLRKWEAPGVRRKFLVTHIAGASPPSYLPDISWERVNSGLGGDNKEFVDAPLPYSPSNPDSDLQPQGDYTGDNTELTSEVDAAANAPLRLFDADSFDWLDAPTIFKLTKSVSKIYMGGYEQTSTPSDQVSTGNTNGAKENVAQLEVSMLVRDPVKRFEHLLVALAELRSRKTIEEFRIIQPADSNQIAQRGGLICWSFLHHEDRSSGKWPKRGWRILEPAIRYGVAIKGVPRTALILEIQCQEMFAYWIEIECREKDGGFLSPVIFSPQKLAHSAFSHIVELLASNEGKNQKSELAREVRGTLNAELVCYKHQYGDKTGNALDIESVKRVLSLINKKSDLPKPD